MNKKKIPAAPGPQEPRTIKEGEQPVKVVSRAEFRHRAYDEIYKTFRQEVDAKIEEFHKKHGADAKMKADSKRMLIIPFLDSLGLDALQKISNEALKIQDRSSNLSVAGREAVIALCNSVVIKFKQMYESDTKEDTDTVAPDQSN